MSIKRAVIQWSATLAALSILLLGGLLASLWLGSHPELTNQTPPAGTFTLWRYAIYTGVLIAWPRLIRYRCRYRTQTDSYPASRWLLITTIATYELLIIHNPLAWLGDLLARRAG